MKDTGVKPAKSKVTGSIMITLPLHPLFLQANCFSLMELFIGKVIKTSLKEIHFSPRI